jgi:hypothetical protein
MAPALEGDEDEGKWVGGGMGSCVGVCVGVLVSQKFMDHKFLCCHHSEKEHEKGVGAYLCAYSW